RRRAGDILPVATAAACTARPARRDRKRSSPAYACERPAESRVELLLPGAAGDAEQLQMVRQTEAGQLAREADGVARVDPAGGGARRGEGGGGRGGEGAAPRAARAGAGRARPR